MINQSNVLYINSKKHQVLKQVDNKFLLDDDKRLIVHNINQNRSTGVIYEKVIENEKENLVGERVVVISVKKIKYIGEEK